MPRTMTDLLASDPPVRIRPLEVASAQDAAGQMPEAASRHRRNRRRADDNHLPADIMTKHALAWTGAV